MIAAKLTDIALRISPKYSHAYFGPFNIHKTYPESLWLHSQRYIPKHPIYAGEWLFVHYKQMFNQDSLDSTRSVH